MRIVLQRVRSASVSVDGREVARIGQGLLALVGFSAQETAPPLARMAERLVSLRLFDDGTGRLNRSLKDIHGELLLVPQVTLTASVAKGTRPSFHTAAPAELARLLFARFVTDVQRIHPQVRMGQFQSHMVVALENDGPVTIILEEPLL